jgi:outer membrane protein assembly factor BamA
MSDFLGYNGYQSIYNDVWRNSKKYTVEEGYKTRAFYKYRRDLLRIAGDIQGPIKGNWKWATGLGMLGYWTGSVNIDMINKGKKKNLLPKDIDGLYEKYVKWGIIDAAEATGGIHPYYRAGFVYDSRNKQTNASKGMYADAFFTYTAGFGKSAPYNNLKFNAVYQHYVPVYNKDVITFAYRIGTQLLVAGKSPFYMDNYLNMLYYQRVLYEAVGGGNSVRGLIRNRVTANGFGYATVEFRFKIAKFDIARQHFYIGLNPFCDMGIALQPKKWNGLKEIGNDLKDEQIVRANIAANDPDFNLDELVNYFNFDKKKIYLPHLTAGMGLKIAMNENFVLSVDWALPFNKQDNHSMANIYVKMGYLF